MKNDSQSSLSNSVQEHDEAQKGVIMSAYNKAIYKLTMSKVSSLSYRIDTWPVLRWSYALFIPNPFWYNFFMVNVPLSFWRRILGVCWWYEVSWVKTSESQGYIALVKALFHTFKYKGIFLKNKALKAGPSRFVTNQ